MTWRRVAVLLVLIGAGGLLLRLYYLPADVPVLSDSLRYFYYARDAAVLDALPTGHYISNTGWPIFLSFFFQFTDPSNYMDSMLLQRLVGVALSVITIIPVYLICRKFFSEKFALIGPVIFIFDPRIAENSFGGLSEPLYVLLISTALVCFLSSQKRLVFFTFPLMAIAVIVRGEAVILLVPFVILYIAKFRPSRRTACEITLLVLVFMLILTPMIIHRIGEDGTDGIFVRIPHEIGIKFFLNEPDVSQDTVGLDPLKELQFNIRSSVKLMPIPLMFLVPYGLYKIFGNMEMKNRTIISILAVMTVIMISVVIITNANQRYVSFMIPILCMLGIFSVKKLVGYFSRQDIALVIVAGMIISSSMVILEPIIEKSTFEKYGRLCMNLADGSSLVEDSPSSQSASEFCDPFRINIDEIRDRRTVP